LVDLDLKTDLRYKVLVERTGFAFFVEFEYENLPSFCEKCSMIGHDISFCKRYPPAEGLQKKNTREKVLCYLKK
jgi:hypothetical protein